MFGFSIFLTEEMTEQKSTYIKKMASIGFSGIFTSLHIPEENPEMYQVRLKQLGLIAKDLQLNLMVDISGNALEAAGFSLERINELKEIGVTGLRMDDRITTKQIAEASHQVTVALNASTISEKDVEELQKYQANFTNLEAWHNYYPRPETGLDQTWFDEKNQWLKQWGFTIQAFVPGDGEKRGPLYEGLPTLENHRHQHPLSAALDLNVDLVYIGDGDLAAGTQKQFALYNEEQTVLLQVEPYDEQIELVLGNHKNRMDEARDVIRSADARFNQPSSVLALPAQKREVGMVTIDNVEYLRYMGEIQVVKRPLSADEKVNVVGRVIEKDRSLLSAIQAGTKFILESVENHE
ncbi:DUF871 domain-containing protein [Enterococcus sp. 669A]|uniref:DUF871 domain-containing protein n=1 Tax=Candidatus Enterococcus moelleringii TaxID=2815325 RepID=A0ABS3LF78_9ENTE|nr:MupG family TIM beta-alpha barrel fold protein [Enterococcus sp. 669A]MBO1308306.1 DUF871 domain-containing protein [Enterococcus sp. 669A]